MRLANRVDVSPRQVARTRSAAVTKLEQRQSSQHRARHDDDDDEYCFSDDDVFGSEPPHDSDDGVKKLHCEALSSSE